MYIAYRPRFVERGNDTQRMEPPVKMERPSCFYPFLGGGYEMAEGVASRLACLCGQLGLHLQALLFTALSTAARDAALPTLSTLARARFHISSAYGSGALLLAFNISTADFLIDVHFTFYLTHRLGLPHPTRSAAAL